MVLRIVSDPTDDDLDRDAIVEFFEFVDDGIDYWEEVWIRGFIQGALEMFEEVGDHI